MTRKTILLLTVLVMLAFVGIACTPSKKPVPPGPARKPAPTTPAPTTPAPTPAPTTPKTTTQNTALHQRAMRVATEVDKIEGIKKSHVVLRDTTAYVGLDLDRNLEGSKVDRIKKEVELRVKSLDSIKNVVVTTDVDTVTRIKKVAEGIKSGKPITSFTKEMQEIGRRMKPTTGR